MFRIKRSPDGRFYATVELAHDTIISTSETFYHKKSVWLWILKKIQGQDFTLGFYVKDLSGKEEVNYPVQGGTRYKLYGGKLPFGIKRIEEK